MKFIYLQLFILLFALSCNKENTTKKEEPKIDPYPYTINQIDAQSLALMRYEYHQANYYVCTSLSKFGFCDCCEDFGPASVSSPPAVLNEFPEEMAMGLVQDFLLQNKEYTGIKNPENIQFSHKQFDQFGNNMFWHFSTENQMFDTIEVIYSRVTIHLENGKVTWCVGNWFPEVYIPEKFNYDRENAKSQLLNTVVSHYEMEDVTIQQENLDESAVRLVIVPIEYESSLKLHLAWEIEIPYPVWYLFYIDVMTGKTIKSEPTII